MSKHTPGPWEYVPQTEHHGPYVTSEFGSTICDCYMMSANTWSYDKPKPINFLHEMAGPNARLIAAAPEMLEALRDCVSILSGEIAGPHQSQGIIREARAAIAKATGETS